MARANISLTDVLVDQFRRQKYDIRAVPIIEGTVAIKFKICRSG